MSLAQLSPTSVQADPAHINSQVKSDQATAAPQANQDAQKAVQATKTDTVTISPQAVKQLASDGDTHAQEIKEKASETASEKLLGRA